jgi:2-oxoglutarate ferredoxin oxidoreductase subunit delta
MAEAMAVETAEGERERKVTPRRRLPRGRVTVFPNWCKGCGLCVEFCPAGVLEQGPDGRVIVAHPEKCTACRWCENHCPDFAIFVADIEPEEEEE